MMYSAVLQLPPQRLDHASGIRIRIKLVANRALGAQLSAGAPFDHSNGPPVCAACDATATAGPTMQVLSGGVSGGDGAEVGVIRKLNEFAGVQLMPRGRWNARIQRGGALPVVYWAHSPASRKPLMRTTRLTCNTSRAPIAFCTDSER